jgi:hypothetical protein
MFNSRFNHSPTMIFGIALQLVKCGILNGSTLSNLINPSQYEYPHDSLYIK